MFPLPTEYFISNLWRWKCGLPEISVPDGDIPDYDKLRQSEWSPRFEEHMRKRLIMGAPRYGKLHDKNKPQFDRIRSIRQRLNLYEMTGNDEILVDIANLALLEFEEGIHPNKHFHAQVDGIHTTT